MDPSTEGPSVSTASSNAAMATGNVNTANAAAANLAGAAPGTTVGTTTDWRDKDADRGARQQIARIMCVLKQKLVCLAGGCTL